MSIALISDTHFGINSFNRIKLDHALKYFEEIFFPYLIKNKITEVIHAGDMVHNRNFMDLLVMDKIKERFFQWFDDNCVTLYALVGNHDSFFKSKIETNFQKTNLKEFKYVITIDSPTIINFGSLNIGFVPWIASTTQDIPFKPEEIDILAGHFEINGVLMHGNSYSSSGTDVTRFADFKQVLSGHFHATSEKKNIKYIGTQYQMDWRDYNNKKGFWVLKDDLTFRFVENTFSPKFYKLYYLEKNDGQIVLKIGGLNQRHLTNVTYDEVIEIVKTNYVKFIIKKYDNHELLSRYYEQISQSAFYKIDLINESSIIEDFDIDKFEEDFDEELDLKEIIANFVKNSQFSRDIKKPSMIKMLCDLYDEAINMDGE